jgi:hypothetical protein
MQASGKVAATAKKDGGPHKVEWTGYAIGADCTLEYRVVFLGKSLEKNDTIVRADTELLPVPTEQESVEVAVLLGPIGPTDGYPCYKDTPTHLLSEGRLSDGRRVWVVYWTTLVETNKNEPPQQHSLSAAKHYIDPTVDFPTKRSRRSVTVSQNSDIRHQDRRPSNITVSRSTPEDHPAHLNAAFNERRTLRPAK